MIYMYVFILVLSIGSGWAMLWHAPKLALREKSQKQKNRSRLLYLRVMKKRTYPFYCPHFKNKPINRLRF